MKIVKPATNYSTAQLYRPATGSYLGSDGLLHTAQYGTPRWQYDPEDLLAGPMLLVESVSNQFTYSASLDNAAWSKVGGSISANSAADPYGTQTADKFIEDASTGEHYIGRSGSGQSGNYTLSAYCSPYGRDWVRIGTSTCYVWFNVSTKTVGSSVGGAVGIIIDAVNSVRCIAVMENLLSSDFKIALGSGDGVSNYTGTGNKGMSVYGIQLQDGLTPTNYLAWGDSSFSWPAEVITGETLSNVPEADYQQYFANVSYAQAERVIVTEIVSEVTLSGTSPLVVNWVDHGLAVGDAVYFSSNYASLPPSEFRTSVTYFIESATADAFTLAETENGPPISVLSSVGTVVTHWVEYWWWPGHGEYVPYPIVMYASRHLIYESLSSANLNNTPHKTPTSWLKIGSTNTWRMFDKVISSQTIQANNIAVSMRPKDRADGIALLNIRAATIRIRMTDEANNVVYSLAHSLTDTSGIATWYDYFFADIVRATEFIVTDLPPYVGATIDITLSAPNDIACCGVCIVGRVQDIGGTQYGLSLGIQDYSIKTKDAFGDYKITERAFNKRAKATVAIPTARINYVHSVLEKFRAKPVVYISSEEYNSSYMYGFYKDFTTVIAYPDYAVCDIELEGLT